MGGWVMGRASWVVRRGSCVVSRESCLIGHASSRRLLLVEFKGTVFLYTTLRICEKVSPIKFSNSKLIREMCPPRSSPIFPHAPRTLCVLNECTWVQENHFRLKENSKILAAFDSHSMSLEKNLPICFLN